MTGYQFNKLAGAVIAALLLFFGSRELINIFGSHEAPHKPGYDVPVSEEAAKATGDEPAEGAAAGEEPLGALLAAASVEAGAGDAKVCGTCHSFEAGGAAKIGPNLHGVVGRDIASVEGFQYSPALSGKEGAWTYEALNAFLKSPKDFAPGTKMIYPGVKEAKQRADLIVYMKSISPDAPALPAADAPAAAAEAGKEAAPEGAAAEQEGKAAEAEEQAAAEEETEQTPAGGEAPQGDPAAPPPGAEAPASPPAPEAPPPPEQAAEAEKPAEQPAAPAEAPAEQPSPAAEPQSAPAPEGGAPQPQAAAPAPATAGGAGNVDAGMKAAKVCQTCHAFEAGAPAKIGPNLHGVVGRPIGGAEGFQYSPGLKGKGGNWDEASLAKFLESPKAFAPGTKMIYPGIKDEKKRADMIAYLKSLSQ